MEAAYDHIQEEVLRTEGKEKSDGQQEQTGNLNTELQEAYNSFSSSAWGVKLGGFLGNVRKQGESYYQGAKNEASIAGEEAMKGFTDLRSTLVSRARSLSMGNTVSGSETSNPASIQRGTSGEEGESSSSGAAKEASPDNLSPESEGFISRFKAEAEKRLKDIQRAEDAADEALLKFGTNIRNFLRDAVTVAPPSEEQQKEGKGNVLFESRDQEGKRVIHTTRFDAQLHVIHCSLDSFTKDPASPEYQKWKNSDFSVEKKTADIAADLAKYEELRRVMEKLVPEKVSYDEFWKRYYFLRMVVETEEKRRREMLKDAALAPEKEISWDEDSDSEPSTPQASEAGAGAATAAPSSQSTATPMASTTALDIKTTATAAAPAPSIAKPNEPRKSQDQNSQSGSDASYDLVSGATSRTPGSPREEKERKTTKGGDAVVEESDEDWE